MAEYCQPHLERSGLKVRATRRVFGTMMCEACYYGKAVNPKREGEGPGTHFNEPRHKPKFSVDAAIKLRDKMMSERAGSQ